MKIYSLIRIGLVKSLATGVYDLIDKSIEEFIKGHIEGGIGIGKGIGSLVKIQFQEHLTLQAK